MSKTRSNAAALLLAATLLAGCASTPQSTTMPADVREKGLVLKRGLPARMADQSAPLAGSQLVLVPTESAAGLVVPVPFVADIVAGQYHKHEASSLAARYASLDVFGTVQRALDGSPVIKGGSGAFALFPVAYLVDCDDARFRVALSGRIEDGPWTGRYTVHLPSAFTEQELAAGAPATIATLEQELDAAAVILRGLLERDAAGTLDASVYHADVGSLHLNCGKVAGLVSPTLLLARGAAVLEDGADHIVVRIAGDLKQTGPSGGLMYGVHYLRKDQLHTLARKP